MPAESGKRHSSKRAPFRSEFDEGTVYGMGPKEFQILFFMTLKFFMQSLCESDRRSNYLNWSRYKK